MSDNRILALKYRPRSFSQLIGQDAVSRTLSLALDSKRLSHAYLFSGLRGSGKTSSARIFSKCLNCDSGPTSQSCEVCDNCINANEGRHIDIIEMDAASSRSINDIRELIEQTKYKPAMGRFKIFIIDEAHMLTKEAFNALLKTLEEPPPFVKFILATTDPLKLPPTILSRTQHFRFKKIAKNDIVRHLEYILNKEGIAFEKEALDILARSGSGSLRDTLTLLDQAIIFSKGSVDSSSVADMLGLIDPQFTENIFDAIFEKDEKRIKKYTTELENYEAEMVIEELIAFLKERLESGDVRFSTLILDRFFRILSDTKSLLSLSVDSHFALTLMFLKMLEALKIKEIDSMIEELESEILAKPEITRQVTQKPTAQQCLGDDRFETLIKKLYDRSYELGTCFENSVAFVSFREGVLTWKSKAVDDCKKLLTSSFAVIKQFVWEIYGINTTIKNTQWIEDESHQKPKETELQSDEENREDMLSACQTSLSDSAITNKPNPQDVLNHPMIEKAKELFAPKRILIATKV